MNAIGTLVGFVFTLFIFSYLLGDNFLYRLAIYIFVGVSAAFASIIMVQNVLLPVLLGPERILLIIAIIFAVLLFLKPSVYGAWITNMGLAILIGVGAALALAGAISGTLIPLALETSTALVNNNLLEASVLFIGVISSLIYFQYTGRKTASGSVQAVAPIQAIRLIGQAFIVITLGTLYGMAIISSLTILTARIAVLFGGIGA